MSTSKSKSARRFQHLNALVDKMLQRVPPRHGLAMMVFFRHADVDRVFRVSTTVLAKSLGVHQRTARKLFADLEAWKAIQLVEPRQGTIPRVFKITGQLSRKKSARGGVSTPSKHTSSVRSDVR
ncbi:hypothetical protein Q31a_43230 [Aureliella helgolandensis]|uniref:Helix-turn-helix domain-containing protein n=1 Tax=Aureliella helgolandensis TaxID=2527968 RepID=A0A518GBI8_9BACT|nr:hypothetical protein Q31a_43230 [Aureliella helgolandensis]